jgi:hypothetical protein
MVRLGIGTVTGKVGRNGFYLDFNSVQPSFDTADSRVHPVDLFGQHLLPFNDNVKFVLKILGHDADMMLEVFRHHIDMMLKHFVYLFEIISVHGFSLRLPVFTTINPNAYSIPQKKPPVSPKLIERLLHNHIPFRLTND